MTRMMLCLCLVGIFFLSLALADEKPSAPKPNGNRLTYLDEPCNPYYVHRDFPKLTTPMWVGEEGVEAVVILGIDDMRGHEKWETYLRPILNRLKQIDGRAPVSIMTCTIDPKHPHLQQWLEEGLSLEVHTVDHPCPLLQGGSGPNPSPLPLGEGGRRPAEGTSGQKTPEDKTNSNADKSKTESNVTTPSPQPSPQGRGGDATTNSPGLAKAKSTYDRCVDLLNEVPNNKPVCFRMPCCDSLNTLSPRFFTEIFAKTTDKGHFLQADSSVFNVFTSDDHALPRELVLESTSGKDARPNSELGTRNSELPRNRFRKYIPADRFFANTIENYPYPYVIDRLCWEFPCVTPSDWSAQHLHKPHNPQTVEDWKAALDCTVIKQGVFCLVFHPHNWIKPEQVNELIDHAVTKHGKKIKFLTFKEAVERLNKNVLVGFSLRHATGEVAGIRFLDDGLGHVGPAVDITEYIASKPPFFMRTWHRKLNRWISSWLSEPPQLPMLKVEGREFPFPILPIAHHDRPFRYALHRLKGTDEKLQLIQTHDDAAVFNSDTDLKASKFHWNRTSFSIPSGVTLPSYDGSDSGLRFIDLNADGHDDIVFSNHERYGIWLWESMKTGWSREVLSAKRGDKPAEQELPPIVRADGSNNGFWVHSRHLIWMNEDTAKSKDLVERRSFDQLLTRRLGIPARPDGASASKDKKTEDKSGKNAQPTEDGPKSPEASLKMMQVKPGYRVELVAAEPLVRDPVAFDWGPDGKLWVAEMADYPLGIGAGEEADGEDSVVRRSASQTHDAERRATLLKQAGHKLGGGRVRILEDTDGDGKYDKSTVFLDKLNFPNGVMPWRDGVLISAAPDVLFARDTNGDGKADEVKVLLTGFGEGNQQHRVNGFSWGLDNMVHCANGDSGGQIKVIGTVPRPAGAGPPPPPPAP